MALEDSRDKRPHPEDLGQSFEAHSGNVGSAFEERNASPELLVHKKSHTVVWVIVIVAVLLAVFLVYYFTKPKTPPGAAGAQGRGQNGPAAITEGQTASGNINVYVTALGRRTRITDSPNAQRKRRHRHPHAVAGGCPRHGPGPGR